jgi:hypothetical protein
VFWLTRFILCILQTLRDGKYQVKVFCLFFPFQLVYYCEFSMYDILNLLHWILSDHFTTAPKPSATKSRFMRHWCSNVSAYISPCWTAFCQLSCRKWLPHHHCTNSYFIAECLGHEAAGSLFIKPVKSHLALYYHLTGLCYCFIVKLYLHICFVLSVICTSLFSKYAL